MLPHTEAVVGVCLNHDIISLVDDLRFADTSIGASSSVLLIGLIVREAR